MTTRCFGRVTGAAALVAMSSAPALAQSNAELMDIIRQQQRQIEELSRKVDVLQGQAQQATEKADTAAQTAQTAQKVEEEAPDIKVKLGPGPTFSSKDGSSWSVHVLGRLMVDGGALGDEDDFYKDDNAVELRAARLGIEGNFLQGWKYKFETDFANSEVDVKAAVRRRSKPSSAVISMPLKGIEQSTDLAERLVSRFEPKVLLLLPFPYRKL